MGHTAAVAFSAEQAFEAVESQTPDAIVLDVRLPGMDGLTAMRRFQQKLGPVPIIVITAYGDLATAVEAVRNGAFEYLIKPFELNVAQRAIERAAAKSEQPSKEEKTEPSAAAAQFFPWQLVGSSPAIQEVFKQIAVVAPTEACVHIHGPSGSGKELVARAIHKYSRRASGPFVPVNLASLSPSLAESELFGHVRGAFTGAGQSRKGLLEQADGGTLFFDEVADVPPAMQVKLLRVLEHGDILPVGGNRPVRSDFRVISATHQNLHRRVVSGEFREDLYYRLITFEIGIPPLAERTGDVAELAEYFLDLFAARGRAGRPDIAPETIEVLRKRPWHGNVRELRNAMEHAIILARGGAVLPDHLPPPTPPAAEPGLTSREMLAELVRDWTNRELNRPTPPTDLHQRLLELIEPPLLETVLERNNNQFVAAAKQLGLHRVTLKRKVNQYREEEENPKNQR